MLSTAELCLEPSLFFISEGFAGRELNIFLSSGLLSAWYFSAVLPDLMQWCCFLPFLVVSPAMVLFIWTLEPRAIICLQLFIAEGMRPLRGG